MASAPPGPQRMPPPFIRSPITVLHALSTGPLPICQPFATRELQHLPTGDRHVVGLHELGLQCVAGRE